jgi:hypothetical protein
MLSRTVPSGLGPNPGRGGGGGELHPLRSERPDWELVAAVDLEEEWAVQAYKDLGYTVVND